MTASPEDVLDGFTHLWTLAQMPALVAGGLHGRGLPAGTELPFAIVRVVPGARVTWGGPPTYLESFAVTAWVHVVKGEPEERTVYRAFNRLDEAQRWWPAQYGRCVHVKPMPAPAEPSPVQASLARDVAVLTAQWDVQMFQERPMLAGVP